MNKRLPSTSRIKSGRRRGVAAVEFAIVAFPFFLLVFGIFEYGRFAMARHLLANAAREGARLAIVNTDVNANASNTSTSQIRQRVLEVMVSEQFSNVNVRISHVDKNGSWVSDDWERGATYQQNIAVEITADFRPIFPTFGMLSPTGSNTIGLTAKSVMRSEGG